MKTTPRVPAIAAALCLLFSAGAASAASLAEAYTASRTRDPALTSARAQADAARERIGVVRAGGAPTVSLGAGANAQYAEVNGGPGGRVDGGNAALNLNLPLYLPQVATAVGQAGLGSESAAMQAAAAEQDLILRVAAGYLDVLVAIENLQAIAGQKAAIAAQLASAKRGFEVGTATIVDPNEAQTRYDLVVAQEIAAQSELSVKRSALAQLTGRGYESFRRIPGDGELTPVVPKVLDEWVEIAQKQNFAVRRARLEQAIAEREVDRRAQGRQPSVALVGSVGRDVNPSVQFDGLRTNSALVGVQLNWPFWDGGAVASGVREAVALGNKAAAETEAASRQADLEIRRLFGRLGSGTAVVAALQAAERSGEITVRSTLRAQQVGVRVTIDVLNAQQQLFFTRRDLARARYDYLLDLLRLRQVAGVLGDADITALSALLSEPVEPPAR
jgi:outer membrane protein